MVDQQKSMTIRVSIIIVSWNSRTDLARCLPSVLASTKGAYELIVIDNASVDGSAEFIQTHYPQIRLICNSTNLGFAAATNQGFATARGDTLVGLNPDTVVTENWLVPLVRAVQQPNVGLATSRICLLSDPTHINAYGNVMSLTGLTFCIGINVIAETYIVPQTSMVPAISGAAFAISRDCYETIGGFDPRYFAYFEDTDISLRARLAGFEIALAVESLVYHDYAFRMAPHKLYYIERNRYLTLLKCFQWRTFLCLLPALLLGEGIVWGFALLRGRNMLRAKRRAWRSIIESLRHDSPQTLIRAVPDRVLVAEMSPQLQFDQVLPEWFARFLNMLLAPLLRFNKWLTLQLIS